LALLSFTHITTDLKLEEIHKLFGFSKVPQLSSEWKELLDETRINLIIHPKSKGSAREWGLDNFSDLLRITPADKYKIFVSGTKEDGELVRPLINNFHHIFDLTGKLSLKEFIAFIYEADSLVAASTGPLHIAAALGKHAIGLYAPMRPIHPGRWMPIGERAHYLVLNKNCNDCRKSMDCHCIREIMPNQVLDILNTIQKPEQ
jgi:ADP-heptose:LPS heptosyltransferase